jgi:hypothetical protein
MCITLHIRCMGFMAVKIPFLVLWVMILCSLVGMYHSHIGLEICTSNYNV